ncbi:MAG: glucose-6-phosphate isomerase [Pseudanabaena sp.]|nr:MAG: glucose-6-phosphate isomerase [Pseudanabaena sp.]
MIANPQPQKSDQLFQPAFPWMMLIGFVFIIVVFSSLGGVGARLTNFLYPTISFAIGYFLYFRYPILYNGLVWWLFFLSPFIRRFCDWRLGAYTPPSSSYILLAPFVVAMISANTMVLNLPKTREQGSAPFVLAIAAVLYGYLVALAKGEGLLPSTVALLEWITPIVFGYHIYVNWSRYPLYSKNLQRVFLWGVLVMGTYGVYQFLVAPEWDRLWLIESGMNTSAGSPTPFGMRVWSTLNSQGPFGDYMVTGLLILLNCKGPLVAPASVFGAFSLLLSLVRAAWIGWMAAMLSLLVSLSAKQKARLLAALVSLTVILIPLINIEPFSGVITARLESMVNLQESGSAQARQYTYAVMIDDALIEIVGNGIGTVDTDSALLVLFFNLGWIGVIPYMGSLIFGNLLIFTERNNKNDLMTAIIRGVLIKSLLFLLAGPTMREAQGMILWGFLGLGLSGRSYYRNFYKQQLLLLTHNDLEVTSDVSSKSGN